MPPKDGCVRMRNLKIKLSLQDMYLGTVCIFPISTMLIDGSIWNKALFAILVGMHIGMLMLRPVKLKTVVALLLLAVHYCFVIAMTRFPMHNYNLLFYYPFFIMYMYYMSDNMEMLTLWLERNKQYIHFVIYAWTLLVGISMFVPRCYYYKEGGELYFGSFCESIFRLGPSALFIQVLALVSQIMYKNKRAIWLMLVPMYCYLMGSSRTYLVTGLCLLVICWYITAGKKLFWTSVLPLAALFLILVWVSPMGEKIRYTLDESNYGDFWFRVTSSRSVIWAECLTEWNQTSIFNRFLGNDLEFTRRASGNWAHNDFIEILCSFGIVGLINYLVVIRRLFKKVFSGTRTPLVITGSVFMTWFFNAFFNMHYVYFCAMLSYPVLMAAMKSWCNTSLMIQADTGKEDNGK